MTGNLVPYLAVWAVMVLAVLVLLVYRQKLAHNEDDTIHVLHGEGAVSQQAATAQKLERVDRWGKIVTVVALLWGLFIAVLYLYKNFTNTGL
jgi:hypothetical protein